MQTESQTKAFTRISIAALMVALLAGVMLGGIFVSAQDGNRPASANDDAEPAKTQPEARRTAYVDFLSLLKNDTPLLGKQQEKADEMQREMDNIDKEFMVLIKEQQRVRELNKPDTIIYRQAMNKQLDFERQRYQQKLLYEQLTQADLRDFAIKRFKELRNLAADIAKGEGYNEVLNVVRNIDEVTEGQDNFQALQQQLLVSPVLYYESAHDITDEVKAKAEKIWGETISFVGWNADAKSGGIRYTIKNGSEPAQRNKDGELEIRLGETGKFEIDVLDKGKPAAEPRNRVSWSKRGVNVGDIGDRDGSYTAPTEAPPGGDTFTITVRSTVDPTVSEEVTIRLLDKDGNRLPAKSDEKKPDEKKPEEK